MKKYYNKPNIIADLLKENRKKNRYSKSYLCSKLDLLGVNLNIDEIHRIETYKRFVKDFELVALCIVLNIDFQDLRRILEEPE